MAADEHADRVIESAKLASVFGQWLILVVSSTVAFWPVGASIGQ